MASKADAAVTWPSAAPEALFRPSSVWRFFFPFAFCVASFVLLISHLHVTGRDVCGGAQCTADALAEQGPGVVDGSRTTQPGRQNTLRIDRLRDLVRRLVDGFLEFVVVTLVDGFVDPLVGLDEGCLD